MVNSGFLDGLPVEEAKAKITAYLEEKGLGRAKENFKLRDWVFSRQRYWGEPIPIVYCERCGFVPLPESELPLKLPDVESYMPTDTGESPLSALEDFVNTTCPKCGGEAKRETDTMPQWAGSSWYFLRYCDPRCGGALACREALDYWLPVDWYNGGMEHTTLHLLYSRFWHKFLYDIGVVRDKEPYSRRTSHGFILGEDNQKMSKSRGNVINPDEVIAEYGADTLRLYQMFIGDFEKAAPWSRSSIKGCKRFLDRVFALGDILAEGDEYRPCLETAIHKTIKKVSEDIESLKFNTAIAALMTLLNNIYAVGSVNAAELKTYLCLLNPFAPHITEELHETLFGGVISAKRWVGYDPALCVDDVTEIAVQVNGKVKARINIPAGAGGEEVIPKAKADAGIAKLLEGKTIVKELYVPDRLVNIVVK
jgi:leucyl-tRNA synthetase